MIALITICVALPAITLILLLNSCGKPISWGFPVIMLVMFYINIATLCIGFETAYKQGQTEALTGNIKYELITQPDSTKTWERIGEK